MQYKYTGQDFFIYKIIEGRIEVRMRRKIIAHTERDSETGLYVGVVPEIPGAHTQAETLDDL